MGGGIIKGHFTSMDSLIKYTALTAVNREDNSLDKQGFVRGHLSCLEMRWTRQDLWHESMDIQ
jgi:hypothetical protein